MSLLQVTRIPITSKKFIHSNNCSQTKIIFNLHLFCTKITADMNVEAHAHANDRVRIRVWSYILYYRVASALLFIFVLHVHSSIWVYKRSTRLYIYPLDSSNGLWNVSMDLASVYVYTLIVSTGDCRPQLRLQILGLLYTRFLIIFCCWLKSKLLFG